MSVRKQRAVMGNFIEWKIESNCYIKTELLRESSSTACAIATAGCRNGSNSPHSLKGDALASLARIFLERELTPAQVQGKIQVNSHLRFQLLEECSGDISPRATLPSGLQRKAVWCPKKLGRMKLMLRNVE